VLDLSLIGQQSSGSHQARQGRLTDGGGNHINNRYGLDLTL
jgi:hypothetical protein